MASLNTKFELKSADWTSLNVDGLVIPVFQSKEKDDDLRFVGNLGSLDKALDKHLSSTATEEGFKGSAGTSLTFRVPAGHKVKARRVILVGLGEADKCKLAKVEKAIEKGLKVVQGLSSYQRAAIALPETPKNTSNDAFMAAVVDGVHQSTYESLEGLAKKSAANKSKKKAKSSESTLSSVTLVTSGTPNAGDKKALTEGIQLAKARSTAKDLVNMPANTKCTDTLADLAKVIGKRSKMKTTVQTNTQWIAKNMPCFYEVAKGSVSSDPPKWITVTYTPSGPIKKKIALVGKSVIFDTGGYQIKPGGSMVTMKGDMTGGGMVLSAMEAIADAQPAGVQITAYCAATPNKIDSGAMLPDAIVDTTCGKKVEIRHTDAEGRLTLIDAVTKACEDTPDEIISIATLTGAAMRAVGMCVALMATDDTLSSRLFETSQLLDEPFQPLLVFDSDHDDIKSKLDGADIRNTSKNMNRGAQSAACFVFAGNTKNIPMVHLDIAGADMTPDEKATGTGVKTLLKYVLSQGNSSPASPKAKSSATKAATKTAVKKAAPTKKSTPKAAPKTTKKVAPKATVKAATKTMKKAAPAVKKSTKAKVKAKTTKKK